MGRLLPDSANVVLYRPAPNRLQVIHLYQTVQSNVDDSLKNDWREEEKAGDQYERHRPELLEMIEDFEEMWDGYPGRITTSRQQIELTSDYV